VFTDGSLALDRHEVWEERETRSHTNVSRTPRGSGWKGAATSVTVPPMPAPRSSGTRLRARRKQERAARRARRLAGFVVIGAVLLVGLFLTAFGGGRSHAPQTVAVAGVLPPAGRPLPEIVATRGPLRLQLPIAQPRRTAVGFHSAGDGAISLAPVGHQGNEGVVLRLFHKLFGGGSGRQTWYELGGDAGAPNSAVDVGAPPGTDVYAPVDGTVVGITPFVVDDESYGVRLDIQPQSAPSYVVSMTQLRADPSISVGSTVIAGVSKVGSVVDLSDVERQALARFTQDAGNHVSLEVRPAATLTLN
jgi:murein DD-endopeptidase MepM/ murein hydrolase activator NlpD